MTSRFIVALTLAVASVAAQKPAGEIAGRITDEQRSPMPGVRISITNADPSTEAVTDPEGRFFFRSLTLGTYRVVAGIPGFKTAFGEVTVSRSTSRAFLAWSLAPGCVEEVQRVLLSPRDAARQVEAIVHIRVAGAAGPVLMSVRPDCNGRVLEEYSIEVIGRAAGRRLRTGPGPEQLFMERLNVPLRPGEQYLALLWPRGYATHELVLPIVSGRVASAGAGELNGLPVDEALAILARWSEEREH